MKWKVVIAGPAQKDFQKLPQRDRTRVKAALVAIEDDPFQGDLKRLKGTATAWRRRVGNYRIIYDLYIEVHLIVISAILRRTSMTYERHKFGDAMPTEMHNAHKYAYLEPEIRINTHISPQNPIHK